MSRWRLLRRRARLLDDIRFAEDVLPNSLATARNRLRRMLRPGASRGSLNLIMSARSRKWFQDHIT